MKILKRRHPHPEIPLVSTADVSFLLLIFFLSTTIFAAQRGITLELPGLGDQPVVLPPSSVAQVRVRADQSVELDGERVPAEALGRSIARKLAARRNLLVQLTVDPEAPYAALVRALDQVKLSGARQISIQSVGEP